MSIVFVLDSSPNMQPRIGRDYFELAREGVEKFLSLPGFPDDGTYEISVIQYAKKDVPGYVKGEPGMSGTYHWFGPVRVVEEDDDTELPECHVGEERICATKQEIIDLAVGIEHTEHFTGMLLESGLREATRLVKDESEGNASTHYHIVLLSTGEYRLNDPCPPEGYCLELGCEGCPSNCPPLCDSVCPPSLCDGNDFQKGCQDGGVCNRVCHVRSAAQTARAIPSWPVTLSAIHVGPNWKNKFPHCGYAFDAESDEPYETNETDFCYSLPQQPDRGGFLQELANTHNCPNKSVGKYERMTPDLTFGYLGPPGEAGDIANTIAKWLCDWGLGGDDTDGPGDSSGDGVPWLCDNCPTVYNPRQRDCNNDGIGDVCQTEAQCCLSGDTPEDCADKLEDDDLDGLCNGLDQCPGGDDCLVRHWANPEECREGLEGTCACDLEVCGCDCDGNGQGDVCQAARREDIQNLTHTDFAFDDPDDPHASDHLDTDFDGIPNCATENPPQCGPIPQQCDLGLFLECDVLPEKYPYGTMLEDFTTVPASGTDAE